MINNHRRRGRVRRERKGPHPALHSLLVEQRLHIRYGWGVEIVRQEGHVRTDDRKRGVTAADTHTLNRPSPSAARSPGAPLPNEN
jgi:hypothetical protein